ncbi:MAG TPA: cysteine hydrolase family protein [Ktedonobacteraceae bacterium]|jgi:nicotinamidase-related amidase|nr:cysteine hydrolase family protein [Ktedonobacteraceae bacterium]
MSSNTALLVIDVQVGLITGESPAYRSRQVLENVAYLLAQARATGTLIVYMQHESDPGTQLAPGQPAWEIHPTVTPAAGEIVLSKRASDSFYQTPLREVLQAHHIQRLIITGCRTEMCVDTTSRAAISRGYDVTLVQDAHSTTDSDLFRAEQIVNHHNYTLEDFGTDEHVIVLQSANNINFE